jgi:hypothetical protein
MRCPCCDMELNGRKREMCPRCNAPTDKPPTCKTCGAILTDEMKCPNRGSHNEFRYWQ